MSFKKMLISGFVGRDARASKMPDGRPVTNFNIAVKTKRQGEEKTEWYPIAVFGEQAETALLLKKGSEVTVEASSFWPAVEEYQDKDGATKEELVIKVICDRFYFHGRKPDNGE